MGSTRSRISRRAAEEAVRTLLRWAGEDPAREGLRDTPRRVVDAYLDWFSGYRIDPAAYLRRTFEEVGGYDEMIVLRDITFESHCEHHMAPMIGRVHIGYLPGSKVVGISKLARVAVDHARELADAHHLAAGEVADVHASAHRRHAVLAVRLGRDVAQHDHLVVAADFLEGAPEVRGRIDPVARKPVEVGVDDPVRGIAQAFAVGILARPAQERAHRLLGRAARDPRSRTPHVTVSP